MWKECVPGQARRGFAVEAGRWGPSLSERRQKLPAHLVVAVSPIGGGAGVFEGRIFCADNMMGALPSPRNTPRTRANVGG